MAQLVTRLHSKLEDPGSDPQTKPSLRVAGNRGGTVPTGEIEAGWTLGLAGQPS